MRCSTNSPTLQQHNRRKRDLGHITDSDNFVVELRRRDKNVFDCLSNKQRTVKYRPAVAYAAGDCAVIAGQSYAATAQVAQQEGRYMARQFNRMAKGKPREPFQYKNLGMLAYIGGNRALADLPNVKGSGYLTWLFWRSVYLTRLVSMKNKILVIFDWLKAITFGRDISRF